MPIDHVARNIIHGLQAEVLKLKDDVEKVKHRCPECAEHCDRFGWSGEEILLEDVVEVSIETAEGDGQDGTK